MSERSVAVVGGGIAGLTAAYDLARAGVDVTVLEAGERWGGKIFSSPVGSEASHGLVDAGPDNFLARVPDGIELCRELGLESQLTVPISPVPAYIYRNGALHQLPVGTILGVPTNFDTLGTTGLVSAAGIERAKRDLESAPTPLTGLTTVGEYCRARLGQEVTDVLIDPMVGGINASSIEHLSLREGAPSLYVAAQRSPSLVEGLRLHRASVGATLGSGSKIPVFHGLQGGMATLIDALVHSLASSANLQLRTSVTPDHMEQLAAEFDHVVVATEAHTAQSLLGSVAPAASELLGQIQHSSVAQLTIRVPRSQIEPLDASGILVPRIEGFHMTACTWFSTKWAQYASPSDVLIRITSGRFKDERATEMDDAALTAQLLEDLAVVYSDPGAPSATRIVRWPNSFPQYAPGHSDLVDQIEHSLAGRAGMGLSVIGNSYRGIGIPATIALARSTVRRILD